MRLAARIGLVQALRQFLGGALHQAQALRGKFAGHL